MGEARALDPVANDRPPTTGQASRKSNHKKKLLPQNPVGFEIMRQPFGAC
jgi:hypothetical protein